MLMRCCLLMEGSWCNKELFLAHTLSYVLRWLSVLYPAETTTYLLCLMDEVRTYW